MGFIKRTTCPVCNSEAISCRLTASDHTVSHESFEIWECASCTLRFTQNVPDQAASGAYYQSSDYISHSDTAKGFINSIYHRVRKITLKNKRRIIETTTGIEKGRLLDIGAGTGAFAATMQDAGWKVIALEPDADTRQRAAALHQLRMEEIEKLFSLDAGFDAITMWHVLEHVHELHAYVNQIKNLLSPNGIAFIAVPNYTSHDATTYRSFWAAYDVPRHLFHFSPKSIHALLSAHGLRLLDTRPMYFDSFYISMLSEKYKHGKGGLISALWTGMVSNLQAAFNREKCSSLIYVIGK